jgi:hypothetical protein
MNDQHNYKFRHNGIDYTIVFTDLSEVLRNFSDSITDDILTQDQDFTEANEVIAQIKSKL